MHVGSRRGARGPGRYFAPPGALPVSRASAASSGENTIHPASSFRRSSQFDSANTSQPPSPRTAASSMEAP